MKIPLLSIFFGLAFTLLFLLSFEFVLYLAGVRPLHETEDPYMGFAAGAPLFVKKQVNGREMMVTAPNKVPQFNPQSFPLTKAPNTYRIFCLGGSTTYGRPYDDATSFCGWLREFLKAADPSRRWEVINAGGISYASYRIARLMEELGGYSPDLFIVYSGHNEFLEEQTYRDIREIPEAFREMNSLAGRTRSYTALRSVIARVSGAVRKKAAGQFKMKSDVKTILGSPGGLDTYTRNDTLEFRILEHFGFSLSRIGQLARAAGAEVLYITPPVNLKDCAPFKSQHRPGLDSAAQAAFQALTDSGRAFENDGRNADALIAYLKALELDNEFAGLHYRLGRVLFALGEKEKAGIHFRLAQDEDICPLRIKSYMPGIIRQTARAASAPLLDFSDRLTQICRKDHGHWLPGEEYFLDHVHLTIDAHHMLALLILDKLKGLGIASPSAEWNENAVSRVREKVMSSIDRKAHIAALHNLARVLHWSGKHEDASRVSARAMELESDALQAKALLTASSAPQSDSSETRGDTSQRKGNAEDSDRHYKQGLSYYGKGDLAAAGREFEKAVSINPLHTSALAAHGHVLIKQGEHTRAIRLFTLALKIDPKLQEARVGLAAALQGAGSK